MINEDEYFFPNQPTLINFYECPSDNISNRYGLIGNRDRSLGGWVGWGGGGGSIM